jgi:hypothetical protein
MRSLLPILAGLLLSTALYAEEAAPPPPPIPDEAPASSSDEELQPEVTIVHRGKDVIQEYRVNGQLYMVKIIPSKGKPYYLVDSDGDGSLETRRSQLDNPEIVQWRIFTW